MDSLWGNPLSGTGTRTTYDGSYDDAYNTGAMGLQQRGFWNMTHKFFGDTTCTTQDQDGRDLCDLWPKTNGDDHITMFRKMAAGTIKAAMVWGQNPAVTEPNQGKIRAGLKELDLLVVADLFETETAACDRKADGVTYLIPTCVARRGSRKRHELRSCSAVARACDDSPRQQQVRSRADAPLRQGPRRRQWLLAHLRTCGTIRPVALDLHQRLRQAVRHARTVGRPVAATAFEDVSGTAEIWRGADATPTTGHRLRFRVGLRADLS